MLSLQEPGDVGGKLSGKLKGRLTREKCQIGYVRRDETGHWGELYWTWDVK